MKPVGKQLQEARLAKNWTPELAARETKIRVDRLHDLEGDDYSHFTSPTYARGFVRTYARALGLDEYKILRQLDNKLPDDDSANIVTDTGVAYLPETSLPPRAAHQDYTGLYIVSALGAVVLLAVAFVLFEAYRVGELSRWFGGKQETVAADTSSTNGAVNPSALTNEPSVVRALPVDGSTPPPPVVEATNAPTATTAPDTNAPPVAPRALPVDPSVIAAGASTNSPSADDNSKPAPRALPVDPSTPAPQIPDQASTPPADAKVPPRALPVNAAELAALPVAEKSDAAATKVAVNSTPPAENSPAAVPPHPSNPVLEPSMPAVAPAAESGDSDKPLVLTASADSFVRVTDLDSADADKPLYAAILHGGESIGFAGHKFSINVGVPSAVDIKLDGVNYGPHSDRTMPETFTVQSHLQ